MRFKVETRSHWSNAISGRRRVFAAVDGETAPEPGPNRPVWLEESDVVAIAASSFASHPQDARVWVSTWKGGASVVLALDEGFQVYDPPPAVLEAALALLPARDRAAVQAEIAAVRARFSPLIVSRHAATVEWLRAEVPALAEAEVLASASAEDVRGREVYGNLPLHLAAECSKVHAVEFSGAAPRGAEYSAADMRSAGACIRTYTVQRLHGEG